MIRLGLRQEMAKSNDSKIDPRATLIYLSIDPKSSMKILFAFQALTLQKGMLLTKGFTRTRAAEMINDLIGTKCVTRASKPTMFEKVPEGETALEHYLTWALAEYERKNPGFVLEFETKEN